MKNVTISVDSAVYEFYRKVGLSAGGLPPEQVMADALFKLAGELSMQALHEKAQKNDRHRVAIHITGFTKQII